MRKLLVEKMRSSGRKPVLAVKTLLGLALCIVPLSITQANGDHGHRDKSGPVVTTDKGLVEGFRAEGITEFLGIADGFGQRMSRALPSREAMSFQQPSC